MKRKDIKENSFKVVHLFPADKFVMQFYDFVENTMGLSNKHLYVMHGKETQYEMPKGKNIVMMYSPGVFKNLNYLHKQINEAEKVIVHGIFGRLLIIILLSHWNQLNKFYWVIWGGDLYIHEQCSPRLIEKLQERIKKKLISRIGHIVTYLKGDYEKAKLWYGAHGKLHQCLMYPSNVQLDGMIENPKRKDTINILAGNSSDPSNYHEVLFKMLSKYAHLNIKVTVPLSYGGGDIEKLLELGWQYLGEKFNPLLNYMEFNEYRKILECMDIALFNHDRQQAMGNTITLLGMGKKVYMRTDVCQYIYLINLGIKVFGINDFNLDHISFIDAKKNMSIVNNNLSKSVLIRQLNNLFET